MPRHVLLTPTPCLTFNYNHHPCSRHGEFMLPAQLHLCPVSPRRSGAIQSREDSLSRTTRALNLPRFGGKDSAGSTSTLGVAISRARPKHLAQPLVLARFPLVPKCPVGFSLRDLCKTRIVASHLHRSRGLLPKHPASVVARAKSDHTVAVSAIEHAMNNSKGHFSAIG